MASDLPPIRRSIEVEYWVIDNQGRLTSPGALVDASPGAEREFVVPMLEIKTTPCSSTAELRDELLGRIQEVLRCADTLNKGLVPLATSLHRDTIEELSSERTRIQNLVFGSSFQYVRHCAGTHIHFEQQPGRAVDQFNTLTALDPALALVNSARHFRGEPLVPGARTELYRHRAYHDASFQGELWSYVANREEWTRHLTDCYDDFRSRALEKGVDRGTVESCFDPTLPESTAWIPVKMRKTFGTVEWRAPDTTLPSEILRLAETMTSIMDRVCRTSVRIGTDLGRITDQEVVLPSFDTVRTHVDLAIENGLSSERVRSYLTRMGFDVDAYSPLVEIFDDAPLTKQHARRLRLESAERLRADVMRHSPVPTK